MLSIVRKENCTPLGRKSTRTCSNGVHDSIAERRRRSAGDTRSREANEGRKERRAGRPGGVCMCGGGLLQGGAEERASWQRVRAQTEFLMGDDPLFTDLSEAIVYDRPGLLSCPSRQTVLRGLIDAALPPVNAKSRERER